MIANPVTATVELLAAAEEITDLTELVHGGDVPSTRTRFMPERCIVVALAGKGVEARGVGARDMVPVSTRRIDVRCYGKHRDHCDDLALTALQVLKQWPGGLTPGRVHVRSYTHASGPVPLRDPETGWLLTVVTMTVLLSDELVPA